jgi:hypothetical protein
MFSCLPGRGIDLLLQSRGDKDLLSSRIPAVKNQALIGMSLFVLALWLAWIVGGKIVAEDMRSVLYGVLIFCGCVVISTALRNWRMGFYLFFVWMLFEDLVRKFMGNSLELFFGKDVLLVIVYVALFMEIRRGREKTFRPPFLVFLSLFVWLGVVQVFNQNSPSILYGLLGFKVYFYYMPLLFVGYALIRNDTDLRKFLVVSAVLAGVISILGIIQAIVGNSFLNPAVLAPELQDLGNLTKVTPLSNIALSLPDSVFVSSGRFDEYVVWMFILTVGTAAYLLLHTPRHRRLIFGVVGIVGVATLLSGSRSTVVGVAMSALVLPAIFLWGAPWRWGQAHRLVKAIRRTAIVSALALAALILFFPEDAGSRITFYAETLDPRSAAYEGGNRSWDYPVDNLLSAFERPNWLLGNGIGTASLGGQYVAKVLGTRPLNISVEEGYGQLIVEMGIVAPFLWILWTGSVMYYSWKVARRLRDTRLFPIAFAIVWYAFMLLYVFTYSGLDAYQNFISNAYLWLLLGILFRLPDLLVIAQPASVVPLKRPVPDGLHF